MRAHVRETFQGVPGVDNDERHHDGSSETRKVCGKYSVRSCDVPVRPSYSGSINVRAL